ncbi:MAG: ATP-binding protein, partial [Anaerotardibacter sp.]
RYLSMIDNGDGVPGGLHETVFEPFVTSKLDTIHTDRWGVHGRGMALYSIRENTQRATILNSKPGLGSVFQVLSDTTVLTEKKDQSSFPVITRDENGGLVLRGPHNIIRTSLEFAIDERRGVTVFFGSPTEIAATLYSFNRKALSILDSVFNDEIENTPYIQRLALAYDDDSFVEIAASLGLPLSNRSAYRILKGEIPPLQPLLTLVSTALDPNAANKGKGSKDSKEAQCKLQKEINVSKEKILNVRPNQRSFKLLDTDKEKLIALVEEWYEELAQANYLEPGIEPSITCTKQEIKVSIPIIHTL